MAYNRLICSSNVFKPGAILTRSTRKTVRNIKALFCHLDAIFKN